MTLWMLWSILFAATVGIAALAIDRAAGGFGAPRRYIWLLALLASAGVPLLLALRRGDAAPVAKELTPLSAATDDATIEIPTVTRPAGGTPAGSAPPFQARIAVSAAAIDRAALVLWIASSSLLALAFGRSILRLRRHRRDWIDATLGGRRVLLSVAEGPAVVGFVRPAIVVPRWAAALDEQAQNMMLRHELEHIRAGDPRALLAAGILLVALPWNAGVWWLVHRLRMAVELDCDARVIRSIGASRDYALMLLEIGERHTTGLPLAATLASGRPLLERRIHAMSSLRPHRPLRAALPFLAIAIVATTAAAWAPRPASLRPPVAPVQQALPGLVVQPPQQAAAAPSPAAQPVRTAPVREPRATRAAPVSPSAAAPARPAPSPRRQQPDRARIAALARENLPDVVLGDTAAEYAVMIFDSADQYVWSTHGVGSVAIEVAGDTRTADERAEFTRANRAEYMGAAAAGRGGGGGRGARGRGAGETAPALGATRGSITGRVAGTSVLEVRPRVSVTRGFLRDSTTGAISVIRDSSGRVDTLTTTYWIGRDSLRKMRLQLDSGTATLRGRGGARGGGGGTVARQSARGRGGRGGVASDSLGDVIARLNELVVRMRDSAAAGDGSYLVRVGRTRLSDPTINRAAGLEEAGQGRSGIEGIPSTSIAFTETYTFAAGELAPAMLRILVVHLTASTPFVKPK
jgi:beta-lactamase regulating signal transducer with metallopeptidase domain